MAQVVADLAIDDTQLGQYGLLLRFVQVLPQSLAQRLLPLLQRRTQTAKLLAAKCLAQRRARPEICPLRNSKGRNTLGRRVLKFHNSSRLLFSLYRPYHKNGRRGHLILSTAHRRPAPHLPRRPVKPSMAEKMPHQCPKIRSNHDTGSTP